MTENCRKETPVCRKESGVSLLFPSGFLFCNPHSAGAGQLIFILTVAAMLVLIY